MGNCISIFDKDGNLIGHSTHGLACGFYVNDIVKKYNPDYNMFSIKDINEQLEPAFSNGTPEDLIILHLFMNDESTFNEADLQYFENGGTAFETDNEQYAIGEAKSLTEQGHPCYVENEYGDEVWYPGEK